ncbi:hypothetical protein CEXT_678081 [Caerostris extrusa]|uniref:Uncharacterized protein n=1 Tax=Caerostris extrusa TaxID=172846 RepID=A0AAV4TIF8_CAEEX|nr:hypothetical protein CEXT_678081 [Caerostris extrusa]
MNYLFLIRQVAALLLYPKFWGHKRPPRNLSNREKRRNSIRYVLDDDDVPTEIPASRQKPIHQPNADPRSPQNYSSNYSSLTQNAQKFDADYCSSHQVRPGSRHPKSNDRAHATLVPPTKTNANEIPAAISLCYKQGDPPPDAPHVLRGAQCMAGLANRALKWGMPEEESAGSFKQDLERRRKTRGPSRQKPIHQPNADPLSPQKARANYSSLTQNAQKLDADHCSSHHVRPGSRQPKSNERAHAALVPSTKTNEDSAAISLCYPAGRPGSPHSITTHALRRCLMHGWTRQQSVKVGNAGKEWWGCGLQGVLRVVY